VRREVVDELRRDNAFSQFGKKGQVGDRAVVGRIFTVKRRLFQDGAYDREFESGWKVAR
jgi:hypothetical protein